MIFGPELAKAVLGGKKTQTRRMVKGPCRYHPGRSYALQTGRGKPAIKRITVTEVREEALGAIGLRDARREGFRTTQEFRDYWTAMYGRFDESRRVWVISFVLGEHTDSPRLLAARPGRGDYVSSSSQSMRGESEAVSAVEQARLTRRSHEHQEAAQIGLYGSHIARIHESLEVVRSLTPSQRGQKALRGVDRYLRTLGEEAL